MPDDPHACPRCHTHSAVLRYRQGFAQRKCTACGLLWWGHAPVPETPEPTRDCTAWNMDHRHTLSCVPRARQGSGLQM